jgi:hypothetical protein
VALMRIDTASTALGRIRSYLRAKAFSPRKGRGRGTSVRSEIHPVGLIVDFDDIYAANQDGFLGCNPGAPLIIRQALREFPDAAVRHRILSLCPMT